MFGTRKFIVSFSSHSYKNLSKQSIGTMSSRLVAVCQMTSVSDKEKNFQVVRDLVIEAKQRNASIAFFPEACDYLADNKRDIVGMAENLEGNTIKNYKQLASEEKIWLSLGGLHEVTADNPDKVYNAHVLINDNGEIVSVYRKIHLFDMDNKETGVRLMESDYAMKGREIVCPISSPVGEIGLSICYDMRFPELALCLRKMGAKILTYPSAFTYETGANHWEAILRTRAIESQCYVIAAAQTGRHNKKRVSWGHSMIVDPWGTVIAQCAEGTGLAIASIDLDFLNRVRMNMPIENHRRTDLYPEIKPLDS
ncbi:deaminated glutathione amidase [Leptopilina heterotoma]|uniref:deaminated glutathione amidase n=1 Tax=Leptopilina heterotoma TaxID=63436 RepID=UPI001CA8A2CC|nr:deaminated glutathione amidase [Leptopilina heterotoma]